MAAIAAKIGQRQVGRGSLSDLVRVDRFSKVFHVDRSWLHLLADQDGDPLRLGRSAIGHGGDGAALPIQRTGCEPGQLEDEPCARRV